MTGSTAADTSRRLDLSFEVPYFLPWRLCCTVVHSWVFSSCSESLDSWNGFIPVMNNRSSYWYATNKITRPSSLTSILVWGLRTQSLLLTVPNRRGRPRCGDITVGAPSRVGHRTGASPRFLVQERQSWTNRHQCSRCSPRPHSQTRLNCRHSISARFFL